MSGPLSATQVSVARTEVQELGVPGQKLLEVCCSTQAAAHSVSMLTLLPHRMCKYAHWMCKHC